MTSTVVDPASDIRDEIATASGMPELVEKIWFHKTASAVIDADRCVGCGGCIAACPSRSIGVADDGKPTLVKMCTGCSACWDYCPLAGLRVERLQQLLLGGDSGADRGAVDQKGHAAATGYPADLGTVRAAYCAKAVQRADGAQDGGVVTALLASLLESGHIDGAVVSRRSDAFHGESYLATTAGEVSASAGSVYHQSHPLAVLNDSLPPGVRRLAFVGTPCQISVLRALQMYPWQYRATVAEAVVLTVALFCTRSFDPGRLEKAVANAGVDTSAVTRLDVRDGQLLARDGNGEELLRRRVAEFRKASLAGCDECADFIGLSADIAVGNLASAPGRSTILVRSATGEDALHAAGSSIATEPLTDLEGISRTASRDRKRAERSSARGLDSEGPLWVSYTEHVAAYSGTDRAPAAPPAYRKYHYDVSC